MARSWREKKSYDQYPKRICRTFHYCQICKDNIHAGEEYYDGGYNRRVHTDCFERMRSNRQKEYNQKITKEQLRRAVNACCTCGGGDPNGGCPACQVWHLLNN